jgi:hypothetical protein
MKTVCDTGSTLCPHKPQCAHLCHFTDAVLTGEAHFENTVITQPELTRKVKAYPIVPEDIEPVPQSWQVIGSVLVGFVLVALMVVGLLLFFTGLWVWSLLI